MKRTIYNRYDSLVSPLKTWLAAQGVRLVMDRKVTCIDHKTENGKLVVTGIQYQRSEVITVDDGDLVFLQNASMTEIPEDVVFTVEYSVRAAQMAVYELLGIERKIPPLSRGAAQHAGSIDVLRWRGKGPYRLSGA